MHKKLLLSGFLIFCLVMSNIEINAASVRTFSDTTVNTTEIDYLFALNVWAYNIASNTKPVEVRLQKVSMTDGHSITFCYGSNCYTFDDNMNWSNIDIVNLKAGDSTLLLLDVSPNSIVGTSKVKVTFQISGNTADKAEFIATFNFNTAGVLETSFEKLNVYPNPAQNILNINSVSENLIGNSFINLFSMDGTLVKSQKLNSDNQSINTSDLPNGSYVFGITNNGRLINSGRNIIISR